MAQRQTFLPNPQVGYRTPNRSLTCSPWCNGNYFNLSQYIALVIRDQMGLTPKGCCINTNYQIDTAILNNDTFFINWIQNVGGIPQILVPGEIISEYTSMAEFQSKKRIHYWVMPNAFPFRQ